jgi:hypothetical protein
MFLHLVTVASVEGNPVEYLANKLQFVKENFIQYRDLEADIDETYNIYLYKIEQIWQWEMQGERQELKKLYRMIKAGRAHRQYVIITMNDLSQLQRILDEKLQNTIFSNCLLLDAKGTPNVSGHRIIVQLNENMWGVNELGHATGTSPGSADR